MFSKNVHYIVNIADICICF